MIAWQQPAHAHEARPTSCEEPWQANGEDGDSQGETVGSDGCFDGVCSN